ncbi:phytase [Opitutaceae bacterium]|nr:phytase [Opitutaceae bacterium]
MPVRFALSFLSAVTIWVAPSVAANEVLVKPRVVTTAARYDTDDPAIWVNRANPADSLVIGTDKDEDGALMVFGLDGVERKDLSVRGILRPNNVDLAYDIAVGGKPTDVAVVAERYAHRLRVYSLPDMRPIDGGGIPVFEGERARDVMGIALYRRPFDGALFAIVSRSDFGAPQQGYSHQYRLVDDGTGQLRGLFVRAFGTWSGRKEIEALAVDTELGYVYASDETYGVRKYLADPAAEDAEDELAVFGTTGFARDHEGISIYPTGPGTGYILVSDQQANTFRIFTREATATDPHDHQLVSVVKLSTLDSDGSDVTAAKLPGFPGGLFVGMSTDQTFHYYAWADIAEAAGLEE